MTALPPQNLFDRFRNGSSSRHVLRRTTTITYRASRGAGSGPNVAHVGATKSSSQGSKQLREPQTSHNRYHNDDTERQLRSDFELALDLAAEQFLDHSTTDPADIASTRDDGEKDLGLDTGRIYTRFQANSHDQQREERAYTTRRKQDDWYSGILDNSRFHEATRQEFFHQAKDERERITREESEAYRRAQEERLAGPRERLAAEAEQRRYELQEEQRAREQAIAARQAQLVAEEEERRRQEEERRARERECAVCLEAADMWLMVEAPCGHWYCREDLRSKEAYLSMPEDTTKCWAFYQKTFTASIKTSSWNLQHPIQYIVAIALAASSYLLREHKDQIASIVHVAERALVDTVGIDLIQAQSALQMLRHNKQGLWPRHKAGEPVQIVLTESRNRAVACT